MSTAIIPFSEGTLIRYYRNGWHVGYFMRYEPPVRAKVAVVLPPILGKKPLRVPIEDLQQLDSSASPS